MKNLIIKIAVSDDIEAYKIVSRLGMEHTVLNADLDGTKETFDKNNRPNCFLKDNSKMKKDVFKN